MSRLLPARLLFIGPLHEAWHGLWARLLHPYRPERYYMRGPGPKAQEKRHG